ncbi:uncharacterized protein LOC129570489 isoform X2 [Sitodiplosis mosellana]|nr:uncharacterized protein LOC129570489 isoform X2 [Sitodiplosis mosellana]
MSSQIKKQNQKRENDEDSSEQNKRQKIEVPEEEADATTKLTDVVDDCLVHIFKHLMLRDLINLADTCTRFQPAAESTFEAKCRGKKIKIRLDHNSNRMQPVKLLDNATIEISDLSSALKVLRHFGSMIPKLSIYFHDKNMDRNAEVARYMNEFCANSLIDIEMIDATKQVVANWTKPFANAESIHLWRSNLGDLNAWFPKIRRLKIFATAREYGCEKEGVTDILRLNQNLQKLRIGGSVFDIKCLENVSGYLQSIRILDLSCYDGFFNLEGRSIHFKSVKELYIWNYVNPVPKIPLSFDQLEKIQFTVRKLDLNDNFKRFVRQNPLLKTLKIFFEESAGNTVSIEQIKLDLAAEFEGVAVDLKQRHSGLKEIKFVPI